jgi:hypothetical protein
LKEIMKHFEVCDNTGEPICWNLIVDVVTPEGESPDQNDEGESDDGGNECIHGYGYCLECGVTGDTKDDGSSSSGSSSSDGSSTSDVPSDTEARDELGGLTEGFDLNFQVAEIDNHASMSSFNNDGSESEGGDPIILKVSVPRSPRSRGSL